MLLRKCQGLQTQLFLLSVSYSHLMDNPLVCTFRVCAVEREETFLPVELLFDRLYACDAYSRVDSILIINRIDNCLCSYFLS